MKAFLIKLLIVGLFAAPAAHFALRTWGPPYTGKYYAVSTGKAMQGPESDGVGGKFLYVRRNLYLPQRPRHAWLQVVGRDRITVYVNGERAGIDGQIHPWAPAALMLDLTPHLTRGKNVIAISAQQYTQLQPTILAAEGGYELQGEQHSITTDGEWRCSHSFDRGKSWWFSPEFDDRKWEPVRLVDAPLAGQVYVPPRAVSAPRDASWITCQRMDGNIAAVRRDFKMEGRPTSGWIRLASSAPYRLAVNGVLIDTQEDGIGIARPAMPTERMYDVTPSLRRGENSIAVQTTTTGELPHVWVDAEVEDAAGNRQSLDSGKTWSATGRSTADWSADEVGNSWQLAVAEVGNLGLNPANFVHELVHITWPDSFRNQRAATAIALALLLAAAAWVSIRLIGNWLSRTTNGVISTLVATLALVLPATLLWGAIYSTYDPRIPTQAVYQPIWFLLAIGLIPLQWLLLAMLGGRVATPVQASTPAVLPSPAQPDSGFKLGPLSYPAWAVVVLLLLGAWLRVRHVAVEPIHHDEVSAYWFTRGVLETGFPGGEVAKDIPYGYAATSELAYYPTALAGLFVEDPVLVLRIPTVLFSIATIALMYYVGMKLFSPLVGLVAAAIYALSPYCIEMSNFGRYFAQLQFFTILTSYYFIRTLQGDGPINIRALWLTGLFFLLMYFSWEGSGFISLAMIPAALIHRRGRLHTILRNPQVWLAMLVMILAYLAQDAHRILQQTQRLWYGTGISDLELFPMWRYPNFLPTFYFFELSWMPDSLVPMLLLLIAIFIALRHPWQDNLRTLLILPLGTSFGMTAVLPLRASRYTYHLIPLAIMAGAVALVVFSYAIYRMGSTARLNRSIAWYPKVIAAAPVFAVLLLACGLTLQVTELHDYRTLAFRTQQLKFPHWEEPLRYVRQHLREGDVVIATFPHAVDHTMYFAKDNPVPTGWRSDYWLQSTLVLQATLDDKRSQPLDRRAGTVMINSLEALRDVFARHERVWFLVSYGANNGLNDKDVNQFVRTNMQVVYEDFLAAVMVRDINHRPIKLDQEDDELLKFGEANFLP